MKKLKKLLSTDFKVDVCNIEFMNHTFTDKTIEVKLFGLFWVEYSQITILL